MSKIGKTGTSGMRKSKSPSKFQTSDIKDKGENATESDAVKEIAKEIYLTDLSIYPPIMEKPLEEEKENLSSKPDTDRQILPSESTPEEEIISFREVVEDYKHRSPQKLPKKGGIVSELDKILTASPQTPLKKLPGTEKPKKIQSSSSSPIKKIHSTDNLISKKEPLYEQLYKIANKPRPEITEDNPKPSPTRNHTEIDKTLYEDAIRRASTHYDFEEFSEIATGITSQRVLAKKYCQEFCSFCENSFCENFSTTEVDFDTFKGLLTDLRFLKEEADEQDQVLTIKLWNAINEKQEKIFLEKTLACHLALLGIYSSQVIVPNLGLPEVINPVALASALSIQLEMRIHKTFHRLNENRRNSQSRAKAVQNLDFPFAPQLNPGTKQLAKKKNEELGGLSSQKRIEHYLQEKKKLQEKAEKEKLEKEQQALKECTFCPKIIKKESPAKPSKHKTLELYEMSKKEKEQQKKSTAELEIEKEMSECTFQPKLQKKKWKEETSGLYSKSVQQQIARMQKAREEEMRKRRITDARTPLKDYEQEKTYSPVGKSPKRVMPMINLSDFDHYDVKEATNESEDLQKGK